MTAKRWAIRCTSGCVLQEENGETIYFNTYAEAEAEALRLTKEANNNPRPMASRWVFTPALVVDAAAVN